VASATVPWILLDVASPSTATRVLHGYGFTQGFQLTGHAGTGMVLNEYLCENHTHNHGVLGFDVATYLVCKGSTIILGYCWG